MSLLPGTEPKRSKYRLLGQVGQGQFGRVYCAVHRQTGQLVALKHLDRQRFPTHRFLRELRFLLSLQHPNIVTCQALEHTPNARYLVMDYCEGGTLRKLITEEQDLAFPHSLKLVIDILTGLDHAHSRDIVHCDIKPENILLVVQPTGWTARISDFGIARLKEEIASQELGNTGSPAYMAPERFYGQYSPTSDLYSVGIVLFELMTGRRPFSGTPAELMSAHLNHPVKLPDTISDIWQPILIKALQKLSARRFHSAKEMLQTIRTAAIREGVWLNSNTVHLPLLQLKDPPPIAPFRFSHRQELPEAVTALALAPAPNPLARSGRPDLHLVQAGQLISQSFNVEAPFLREDRTAAVLPGSVQRLLSCPQGCYAISDRAVYLIPAHGLVSAHGESGQSESSDRLVPPPPELLYQFDQERVMTIGPGGCWLATLENAQTSVGSLSILRLPQSPRSMAIATHSVPVSLANPFASPVSPASTPASTPVFTGERATTFPQLLALDVRHLAVLTATIKTGQRQRDDEKAIGTLVQVFTRRGSYVGNLTLPIHIDQAIPTCHPYQLLASDRHHSQTIALIDLKPYRITRFAVEILPDFLVPTAWGVVLATAQGEIVLLDQEGRQVGRIEGPPGITAIAVANPHTLLMATWHHQQGHFYGLDLRELEVDLLF